MIEFLVRKLSRYDPPSPRAAQALREILTPPRRYRRGEQIVRQFAEPRESTLILEGVAGRLVTLETGAEQLTAMQVRGDFVDLHGFVLRKLDHSVVALTDCVVTGAPHGDVKAITEAFPALARGLWFLTMVDAAIHRQWLTVIGRRDARRRLAHLLCELLLRLKDVDLADEAGFELPLRQADVANALCLSPVHLNRVLQDLRARGLVEWRRGRVDILDWPALRALAEFEPTYLQMDSPPRF